MVRGVQEMDRPLGTARQVLGTAHVAHDQKRGLPGSGAEHACRQGKEALAAQVGLAACSPGALATHRNRRCFCSSSLSSPTEPHLSASGAA